MSTTLLMRRTRRVRDPNVKLASSGVAAVTYIGIPPDSNEATLIKREHALLRDLAGRKFVTPLHPLADVLMHNDAYPVLG